MGRTIVSIEKLRNNPNRIQELMDTAYLGLGDTADMVLRNPLTERTQFDIQNPHVHLLRLMRQPEYFWFTCKWLFNINLLPFQLVILRELWTRKFPMLVASRGGGKTWILSLYAMLRALFDQGSKIVIVGAAFRQSKLLFEYMETFWRDAPIIRHMVGSGKHQGPKRDVDRCNFYVGRSVISAIPLGDGTKIRGLRATHTIADEFASIPQEVFETVVGGFSSVNLDPVEAVKRRAQVDLLKTINAWTDDMEKEDLAATQGNQTVFSGTAYYSFNHFAEYWKKWSHIVRWGNDKRMMSELFNGEIPRRFTSRDYSVVRIPYHKLPDGFMDEGTVARAKATIHSSLYQMEYGACFCTDSDGFFKRSLLESCICTQLLNDPFGFSAVTRGNPNAKYVYGVDPASEKDNFAIIIIEIGEIHNHIVYSWTMNRAKHRQRLKKNTTNEHDFYGYCARKIRELMKVFPTDHIAIDAQGGGRAIMEVLQDPNRLNDGERRLLPYTKQKDDNFWWEKEDKPTDGETGKHIIHSIEFAKADWTSEANHGLRKDFEDTILLFPHFDPWVIEESIAFDKHKGSAKTDEEYKLHDTLEDCVMEIEDLKSELTTIEYSQTGTSQRDKWDTPEVVVGGGKKGRLRKDRYSALVMANMIARTLDRAVAPAPYQPSGGFVGKDFSSVNADGRLYHGPVNLTSKMNGTYGMGVRRR